MKTLQDYIKLADSATDGPWEWDSKPWDYDREEEAPWLVSIQDPYHAIIAVHSGDTVLEPDAQFIAVSRTLGPDMAKALIEAEVAMKDAEMALYCMNIPENGPERRQLKEALAQIQALNGEHA